MFLDDADHFKFFSCDNEGNLVSSDGEDVVSDRLLTGPSNHTHIRAVLYLSALTRIFYRSPPVKTTSQNHQSKPPVKTRNFASVSP